MQRNDRELARMQRPVIMKIPNLFVIAPPRSGTTQLAAWLNSHPDISSAAIKEPNYFAQDELCSMARKLNDIPPQHALQAEPMRYQFAVTTELDTYRRLYAKIKAPYRLDASTTYFTHPTAFEQILDLAPQARAIVVLRDPFDRAISHYRLSVRTGQTLAPLNTQISHELSHTTPEPEKFILRPSLYRQPLERLDRHWPAHQRLYIHFRDLCLRPNTVLERIAEFLDLQPSFNLSIMKRNASYPARLPWLSAALWTAGLHSKLRRARSPKHKDFLRPLWFSQSQRINITAEDRLYLRHALSYHEDYCPAP